MATDTERLILQMSADLKQFENAMLTAAGQADRAAQRIEQRFQRMNQQAVRDFQNFRNQVSQIIAALGLAVVVRDVAELHDEWTRVGNRLALAGLNAGQIAVNQRMIALTARETHTELEATSLVYTQILEASRALGLSQAQVAQITRTILEATHDMPGGEGVAQNIALGLAQGQMEVRQVRSLLRENLPLAQAIADAMHVSMSELRQMAKDGEISATRFAQALLDIGPIVERNASRTATTLKDAFTDLRTAATEFVGTQSSTHGGIVAFTDLVEHVANNFTDLANTVIVAATVLGGAFAGVAVARAIIGISALVTSTEALAGLMAFLGGPVGIALAAAGVGMAYLATQTDIFSSATQRAARESAALAPAFDIIRGMPPVANEAADATRRMGTEAHNATDPTRQLGGAADGTAGHMRDQAGATNDATTALRAMQIQIIENAIATERHNIATENLMITLRNLGGLFASGAHFGFDPGEQRARDAGTIEGRNAASRNRIAQAENMIAEQLDPTLQRLRRGETSNTRLQGNGGNPNAPLGGGRGGPTLEELRLSEQLSLARLAHDTARANKIADILDIEKLTDQLVRAGLSQDEARAEAEGAIAKRRAISNDEQARSLELTNLQDQAEIARAQGLQDVSDKLHDEYEIRQRIRRLTEEGMGVEEAKQRATAVVNALREAADVQRKRSIDERETQNELDVARARHDTAAIAALEHQVALQQTLNELRQEGFAPDVAAKMAEEQVAALEQADIQGQFREWFAGGAMAAFNGDLNDFMRNWWRGVYERAMTDALNSVADLIYSIFKQAISSAFPSSSGGGGLFGFLGGLFGGSSGGSEVGQFWNKIPGLAGGGSVSPGNLYMVGEHGPEPFIPKVPGFILPTGSLNGGGMQFVDARIINFQGTSEELAQLRAVLADDMKSRRAQIQAVMEDSVGRRQVFR